MERGDTQPEAIRLCRSGPGTASRMLPCDREPGDMGKAPVIGVRVVCRGVSGLPACSIDRFSDCWLCLTFVLEKNSKKGGRKTHLFRQVVLSSCVCVFFNKNYLSEKWSNCFVSVFNGKTT